MSRPAKRKPRQPKQAAAEKTAAETAETTLRVKVRKGESHAEALARTSLRPAVLAGVSVRAYSRNLGEPDINALVAELEKQFERAASGELPEIAAASLIAHALTLSALFHNLVRRASGETRLEHFAALLKLALRAQSGSRAAFETLSLVQNPRTTFVGQNAVLLSSDHARARELEIAQSKLLTEEVRDGARLDLGAKASPVGGDSQVEALAALERASHARGQGEGGAQPVQGRPSASAPPNRESSPRARKTNGRGEGLDG